MRHFILLFSFLITPVFGFAQTEAEEEDKGYLTELIEDNLSGVSREVNISGFSGALSSAASIEVLTIEDADGVWLTLEDVVLDWNRSALLRGRIEVEELSAQRIIVARPPISEETGPTPEATPFALPDLPVSVMINKFAIERVELGDVFLGEPFAASLTGNASLADGEGAAEIVAQRLDGKAGSFEINGTYVNETKVLGLSIALEEAPDGVAARLIGLPGSPSVALSINGTGPITDYAAELSLATDGQERVAGDFRLITDDQGQLVNLDISGDVAPLLAPDYRTFFGNDVSLVVAARQLPEGGIDLSNLDLTTQRLTIKGNVVLDQDNWPEQIAVTGEIAALENEPILLPISGPKTFLNSASFEVNHNATVSADWTTQLRVAGFDRPGLFIDEISLDGGGILTQGEGVGIGVITADIDYAATGLVLDDAGAADALGDEISGSFKASGVEGQPTQITAFSLAGPGLEADATAVIAGPDNGFEIEAIIDLTVETLNRFSTLADRDLAGSAAANIQVIATPLDGLFDVIMTGQTNDLAIGIEQADALLRGNGALDIAIVRDTEGTRLDKLSVATDAARINATADLTSEGSRAQFDADLTDLALIVPELSGPTRINGNVIVDAENKTDFAINGTGPSVSLTASGTVEPADVGQMINAMVDANVTDLSAYAEITNMPLSGAAEMSVDGTLMTNTLLFDADIKANTRNLVLGIDQVDPLLSGDVILSTKVARETLDQFAVSDFKLNGDYVSANADVTYSETGPANADVDVQISDASRLDPRLNGQLTARLLADRGADGIATVDLTANGPGANIDLDATVAAPADNYKIDGVLKAAVAELRSYRQIAGIPISGRVDTTIQGSLFPDLTAFDLQATATTGNLAIGNPTVDVLLAGNGQLDVAAALSDQKLTVSQLDASTRNITVSATLDGSDGAGRGQFDATLRDVGLLTDQLSGPAQVVGTAGLTEDGNWQVDASGTGPGGITLNVDGQVRQNGQQFDLDVTGSAPLGLANKAIEPRRVSGDAIFDLSVNGPPQLSSVTGRVNIQDGRLAAPTLSQALSNIRGGITLNGQTARLGIQGDVDGGGGISISGPVGLTSPNNADINVQLSNIVLEDPTLYKSSVDGVITMRGPLRGGASIAGTLNIGETDVQVPSSSVSALGELPDVQHIGANTAVRRTLDRAGLSEQPAARDDASSNRANFPLNITVNAPSRIFIRGRGLDAELGGSLNLGGTTNNIIPVGRFDLIRGRIDILQQRFELTEGSASLQGDFEPFIRLVAVTEANTGTVIRIVVQGPASEPEVTFESTPDLPQDEVLSQLIFGRSLEDISPLQAIQLASAVSTLAGRGGGALDSLRENIGLDDFDVTTDDEGNAAVRAGKYLSDNVYTDVTINSEGETEINLNLDITSEITAKGSVDQAGGTSVGVFFERDY